MLIKNANKIVLKLGSATVVDSKGIFKEKWVTSLIKDIKKYGKGKNFVIVSSGAIALGQKYLKIKKGNIKLEMSQAIAAVGQIHLAGEFQKLFDKYKIKTGQILISLDDTEQRRRAINVRRTFDNLFNSYKKIKLELSNYDKNLIKKKEIIFFNKSDLIEDNMLNEKLKEFKKKIKTNYEIISVYSSKDIQKIKKLLIKYAN